MRAALPLAIATLVATGCGGERSFEPEEFIDAINAAGAEVTLGEPLTSIQEGIDIYALSFEEAPGEHGAGGSMIVTESAEAAREEHGRCQNAVTLVCYRAANVVLMFDADPSDEHVARVDSAIRALATED